MNERAMSDETLDKFLSVAGSLDWPGPARNPKFEEFLMVQAESDRARRLRRSKFFLTLGVLLAGGTVFGAAKLYESYRVRVNINGVTHERDVTPGPDGTATIVEQLAGGGKAQIIVGPENIGADGKIHVGINVAPGDPAGVSAVEGFALPEGFLEGMNTPPGESPVRVEGVPLTEKPDADEDRGN